MKKSTRLSTAPDIFADTSGFYAILIQRDPMHTRARELLARAARSSFRYITTDYILDETATLLRARGHGDLAEAFFQNIFSSAACQIEWMDPERFGQTRQFFAKHQDKSWSFTDCFSFLVMRGLGLRDALTSDAHFRQAGFNAQLL
jgi:predicted nucleic acid-binding protein